MSGLNKAQLEGILKGIFGDSVLDVEGVKGQIDTYFTTLAVHEPMEGGFRCVSETDTTATYSIAGIEHTVDLRPLGVACDSCEPMKGKTEAEMRTCKVKNFLEATERGFKNVICHHQFVFKDEYK